MNILFFLMPKNEVDCVYEDDTLGQALHRMEDHEFTSIPLINEVTGKYVGTLAEGDILRDIRNRKVNLHTELDRSIMKVKRKRDYAPVRASADISELFQAAMTQNFVPVVDDSGIFIGIVTRSCILQSMMKSYNEMMTSYNELKSQTQRSATP